MPTDLPDYYFRLRDNGAAVFRVDTQDRQRRLSMTQIAVATLRSGEVRPHGGEVLTPQDQQAIADWLAARRELLARRERDERQACVDQLNLTAHWAQSRASPAELEEITEPLLMAMHDLRGVLVRKRAERMAGPGT